MAMINRNVKLGALRAKDFGMKSCMRRATHYLKIGNAVVRLVSVLVMDKLRGFQRTSEMLLHNHPVLPKITAIALVAGGAVWFKNKYVTALVLCSSLPVIAAFSKEELRKVFTEAFSVAESWATDLKRSLWNIFLLPAGFARNELTCMPERRMAPEVLHNTPSGVNPIEWLTTTAWTVHAFIMPREGRNCKTKVWGYCLGMEGLR